MVYCTEVRLLLSNEWGKVEESERVTRLLALGLAGPFPVSSGERMGEWPAELWPGSRHLLRGVAEEPGSAVSIGEHALSFQPTGNTQAPWEPAEGVVYKS